MGQEGLTHIHNPHPALREVSGPWAVILSLAYLFISWACPRRSSFMSFASQALAFALLLADFAGLCWTLLRILQAKHSQSLLLGYVGFPSRTFALRNSSWSKPARWEGSQYGFHQMASPHRASTLPLMWPKFASDVLGTLHPAIEVNSWGPELSNMIPLAVKMLLSLPSRAD